MFVFRVFSIVLLVCFMSECAFAVPMYEKVGGSVVLDSGHKSGTLNSVTWKHQADLALEWFGSEITCYRTFKGRCNLDKTTGSFTITNLTVEDGGNYTPEINSVVGGTMELKVIKPVPKPKVSMACNTEKTVCNLTCNANISSEFGSITYKWKTGDTELSNKKELSLTAKNEDPSFLCVLGNPVSNSASDEFSNPISKGTNIALVTILVILGILLIGFIAALVMFRKVIRAKAMSLRRCFSRNRDNVSRGQDEVGEAEEGQSLLTVPQPPVENKSKDKVELNGYQPVNVNEDVSIEQQQLLDPPTEQVSNNETEPGQISTSEETKPTAEGPEINNTNHAVVSIEQQQLLDPPTEQVSDNEAEPGQISESEETKPTAEGPGINNTNHAVVLTELQQQDPPTEQVSDNQAEPGQISESEETEPTAEGPENKSKGKEALNWEVKVNEDVSIEQQQLLDPPTEQVSNNETEPGQSSESDETKPTAEGPEKPKDSTCDPPADTEPEQEIVSPLKPRRAVTPGTDSAES